MTAVPTPPPPGWYPAPDGSPATWWWDGARWMRPGHEPAPQPGSTTAIAKLATATQVLLVACGVMSVVTIGRELFGMSAITSYLDGNGAAIDLLDAYDQATVVSGILSSVALISTCVLWVIWQHRVAKQVSGLTRRSPGWHAGSWFVPIVSLWFPYQNITDLWRAIGRSRPSWQIVWWVLWVVSGVVNQTSSRILLTAEDLDQLRAAMWTSVAGEVLLLAAAPLAWLIVRGITQGIVQRAAAPVYASVA